MTENARHVILVFSVAIGLVIAGVAIADPSDFPCPWTAISGTVPSEGGPTGGGDYGGNASGGP